MENFGWIKIHRKLLQNPIASKPDYLAIWIWILSLANHQDKEFIFNNEKMVCRRGQFITSRQKLASISGVHRSKVDRILNYLKIEHQIEQQTFNKFRLITIVNYDTYQQVEQQSEQQVSNKRAASEHQVSTNKNEKNIKNEKNNMRIEDFETFWNTYPLKKDRKKSLEKFLKLDKELLPRILSAIDRQKKEKIALKEKKEFCPEWKHPTTWINGECWNDEVVETQKSQMPTRSFTF